MEIGMKLQQTRPVTEQVTAESLDPSMMPVLATPWLIAFLEDVAAKCVEGELPRTQVTLGTMVNIRHLSATPVGMDVTCEAVLIGIDRRKLTFGVRAWDAAGPICEGTHERFIVDRKVFMQRANAKLKG